MSSNVQPVVIWTVFKTLVPADGSRNYPVKQELYIRKRRAGTRHFHSLSIALSARRPLQLPEDDQRRRDQLQQQLQARPAPGETTMNFRMIFNAFLKNPVSSSVYTQASTLYCSA